MKVSISWLKELVDLKIPIAEVIRLLPLRTIGIKEVTSDFIELDMKGYNRADLLSMRGVATEVAAITDSKVKFPDNELKADYSLPKAEVTIEYPNLCPVYCIAKIENLKVEDSNDTWVKKLSDCGLRAVNNIADVTNLIMLEYGQPLHAFDVSQVKDETLIVRTANKGETITTLDGKVRKLERIDLLITDLEKPLGIAGVMGGQNSEVTDKTTSIFLEAAIFDPVSIRKTTTRLGLQSEASKRFQHGLTRKRLLQALDAGIKMYKDLGGKLTALSIVGNLTESVKKVKLTQKKLNSLIGIKIKPDDVEGYLEKLNFKAKRTGAKLNHLEGGLGLHPRGVVWEVIVPYWRLDIEIEEDLIEEVARMLGYEKIPPQKLADKLPKKIDQRLFNLIYDLKTALKDAGLTEVQTYSFYSTDVLNNLSWDKESLVRITNPISSETEYLREDLWPNLLEVVTKNVRSGYKDVAIFEIGKVYHSNKKPKESYRLSLALSNGSDDPSPELYQIFQETLKHLRGEKMSFHLGEGKAGEYEKKYFHPTRFSFLEYRGKNIGGIAEIHPRFVNRFGIEKRVAVLEIELEQSHLNHT